MRSAAPPAPAAGPAAAESPAGRAPGPPAGRLQLPARAAEDFLRSHVREHPRRRSQRELWRRWLDTPVPREEVARREGMPLGALLRAFNEGSPVGPALGYRYGGVPFAVAAMEGVCDDVHGERFPKFGDPVTLRVYLTDPGVLPQRMYEAADWNFMDAGRPGFVGYAYGVRHAGAYYAAGLQSDLAVRYAYLFQGRGGRTEVRSGDEVHERPAGDLAAAYGRFVPALRRAFQRRWIEVLLGGVCTWARAAGVEEVGLLQFEAEEHERARGHVVQRVYRDLPGRLGALPRDVCIGATRHRYAVGRREDLERFLAPRLAPAGEGTAA